MAIENSRENKGIVAIEHAGCLMVYLSTYQQQRADSGLEFRLKPGCQGVESLICVVISSFGFDRMVSIGVVKEDWFGALEQLFVNQVADLAWSVKE
ncbi:hypothetical protein J4E90_004522 [Alternaria incomplexa]|uniref:uncharacterized protein n=1 Tax=Alternaria incomplexa TaxID=1187928 RepID=UPI00221FDEF5|nr:uncharacterized protein J4E90_004522 [Alternaria incomplexa]KAI4916076.1 hypothetical protein J4E90_004522 [Alternaria incomplexa]